MNTLLKNVMYPNVSIKCRLCVAAFQSSMLMCVPLFKELMSNKPRKF